MSERHDGRRQGQASSGNAQAPGHHGIDTSEATVSLFLDAALPLLGVEDEASVVEAPICPVYSWLPAAVEAMQRREGTVVGAELAAKPGSRERDVVSFARLLGDALVEIASEEVKEKPRMLGWCRPGFGEPPLSRYHAQQAREGQVATPQQTWTKVRSRLGEAVRFGCRFDSGDGDAVGTSGAPGSLDSEGPGGALVNIDEGIDALLEEEICTDEASWLDISKDERLVKNQVVQMIFADLIDETVAEVKEMWPT